MSVNSDIGCILSEMRRRKRMTQQMLADRCNDITPGLFSTEMISDWERGRTRIPVEKLCTVAQALECTADSIIRRLPQDAVRDARVVIDTLNSLSKQNLDAVHWIFSQWHGDIGLLIQLMLMYCSMAPAYRAEMSGAGVHWYLSAKAAGAVDGAAPLPDISSLHSAILDIATK